MSLILGLDIATTTGWCLLKSPTRARTGLWKLKGCRGERAMQLGSHLMGVFASEKLDLVAFEEPAHMKGFKTRTMLVALQTVAEMTCEQWGLPYVSVPVSTLKKFATGDGFASKEDMMEAAWSTLHRQLSNDEADAYHVAVWALQNAEYS